MKEYDLQTFLKKYSNSTVDFFRFNGNYGDSLIWHGTMTLLNKLSIQVNCVDLNSSIHTHTFYPMGVAKLLNHYD